MAAIAAVGALMSVSGVVLAVTAVPVEAATLNCNAALAGAPLVPGASGTCAFTFTYTETPAQTQNQPFTVTLDVAATSISGGGSSHRGTASEALLDGRTTGLQVTVSDSAGNTFGIGTPSCTGSYPYATHCSTADRGQAVPGAAGVATWSDTFAVAWSLPISAGNAYQGGSATVSVTADCNGIPAAPSSSVGPAGGIAGVSTPFTGASLVSVASLILILVGMSLTLFSVTRIGAAGRWRQPTP